MVEKWDAYDKNFNKIDNLILIRGNTLPDDVFHLVGEVIVKHKDGTYLLMQRDYCKHFGGKWELTAGGSALQGETAKECAIRELREETGIYVDNVTEIGVVLHEVHHTIFVYFLAEVNCDKQSIVLQKGETIAYKWVCKDELEKMKNDLNSLSILMELNKKWRL